MLSGLISKRKYILLVWKRLVLGPLSRSRMDLVRVTGLQLASAALQLAGFVLMIRFTSLIINDWSLSFQGSTYDFSQHRMFLFWAVFGLTLICMLMGAWFSYVARKITASLARITEENVLSQVTRAYVEIFSNPPSDLNALPDLTTLKSFYNRGGRFAGRMVMAVTSSIMPLVIMVISLGFLFYIKPVLTTFLVILVIFSIPVFLKIAGKGRAASDGILENARNSTLDKNRHLDCLRLSLLRPEPSSDDDVRMNKTPAAVKFMEAYERRLRITALSTFFVQTVIVIMLAAVFLAAIYPVILEADFSVDSTLIYLVAFKFFGTGLIACTNALVMLNVFYSYCRTLVPFLEMSSVRNKARSGTRHARESPPRAQKLDITPGSPVLVNLYAEADWSNIGFMLQSLGCLSGEVSQNLLNRTALLSSRVPLMGGDIPDRMRLMDDSRAQKLVAQFKEMSLADKGIAKYVRYLAPESFAGQNWDKLPEGIKILAKALLVKEKTGTWQVIIDGAAYLRVSVPVRVKLFEILGKHRLFVVIPGKFKYKHFDGEIFKVMACVSPSGLEWIGDFNTARQKDITIELFYEADEPGQEQADLLEEF